MLTRQNRFTFGQIRRASSRASCDGLLCLNPPSMYQAPGAGTSTNIGLKNDGAALVERAAFQMGHSSASRPVHPYERNNTAGPSPLAPLVATTNVGQISCPEPVVSAMVAFSWFSFSLMMLFITRSRTDASKRHLSSPVG